MLSLGAIENYYASTSKSRDKVKQAISYRAACESLDSYVADLGENAEIIEKELRVVMGAIFEKGSQLAEVEADDELAA